MLLFGLSYLYGLTGTTNASAVARTLSAARDGGAGSLAAAAAVMVLAGLGFRVTAFPFHWYAPDVYQAGPTGVVAQLSFVPKLVVVALSILSYLLLSEPCKRKRVAKRVFTTYTKVFLGRSDTDVVEAIVVDSNTTIPHPHPFNFFVLHVFNGSVSKFCATMTVDALGFQNGKHVVGEGEDGRQRLSAGIC